MGRVIVSEFVSLDGVMEAPDQWHLQFFNDEMGKAKDEELSAADALLLGRVTYEGFAASWPTEEHREWMETDASVAGKVESVDEFTQRMNSIPKFVVSKTLASADWQNSTVLRGDLADEVSRLKRDLERDIVVMGSATLAQGLTERGLVDEYRLMIHPIVVGKGKRLFADGNSTPPLKLVDSQPTPTGVLMLTYRPA